jgi:serine/threonine protein kinase/Flp pilus assembly protein TadD
MAEPPTEEMRRRWALGERPPAEELLARHPELFQEETTALDVVYEEICLREQEGENGVWEHAAERFPQWRTQLQSLQECHRLLQPAGPLPQYPEVGEQLGEYRLLDELGRGACGRVFLAVEPSLADRPVVLKLVPLRGSEHLSLARLQHTNIVPLYAAREDRRRRLRILCMPFLGRATLAHLLAQLAPVPPGQRTGQHLIAALDRLREEGPHAPPSAAALKQFLARASYVQTICWIGACCADALHYAHERGLVHLDVKPSNVLIAADGQPLLLDFHLAREPLRPGLAAVDELGGTVAYMPPEQRAAMEDVNAGREVRALVDGRADLYSLCAVLYEALGGRPPSRLREPLCARNPCVSPGLADILLRGLAQEAERRYPDAAALAADLRRHLTHQPLLGVSNRSLSERWQKWRRRRPALVQRTLGGLVLLGAGLVVAASAWFYVAQQHDQAAHALGEGQRQWQERQDYEGAVATLRQGVAVAQDLPFQGNLVQQLKEQLLLAEAAQAEAERRHLAADLHRQAEQLRMLVGLDTISKPQAQELERTTRDLWEKRALIRERLGGPGREEVDNDLLDVALAWIELAVERAGPERAPSARRQALQVLEEAEALTGRRALIEYERNLQRQALGLPPVNSTVSLEPRGAWEQAALGRALLQAGQLDEALQRLRQARDLEPQDVWSNYYYGVCAYRKKQYEEAALAFSVCVGAAPHVAGCFYNRALSLAALGRPEQAIHDYDRALQLDPTLTGALVNRGMLRYQAKQYDLARADLEEALTRGANPALVNYDLALVYMAQHQPEAAVACVERALQHEPRHAEALRLREQLRRSK